MAREALSGKDVSISTHIKELWQHQLIVILLTSSGSAAVGLVAARGFVLALTRLAATARKVAEGNLGARSHIRRRDELGELARTFDAMVPKLKRHMGIMQAMEVAHQAQSRLCPRGVVNSGSLKAAGDISVCDLLGGDLFHIARVKDGLVLTVADVSGHGPAVGLLMALTKAYLTVAAATLSPHLILRKLNRWLGKDLRENSFVTMCSVHVRKNGEMTAASAGHPPIFLGRNGGIVPIKNGGAHGVVLGAVPDFNYSQFPLGRLKKGDTLVLVSDGIFELKDVRGKPFVETALAKLLTRERPLDEACAAILKSARQRGRAVAEDDMTVVLARL